MKNIVLEDLEIKINKERVLKSLNCFEGNSVYDTVSGYYDELETTVSDLVSPCAAAAFDGDKVYCLVTLGGSISDYSKSLFDAGEGMKGILVNAMADDCIFETDKKLTNAVKLQCAADGLGVRKRLAAPEDIPLSDQKTIAEKTGLKNVSLTDAFMFSPDKTLGYVLELTRDRSVFKAEHDCSSCPNTDCPMRGVYGGNFAAVAEYAYDGRTAAGDSAVCIDIGTTTVAFALITEKGAQKTYKTVNPQRRFGHDVLSRIDAANRGRNDELSSDIRYTLLTGYREVTKGYGDVKKVVIAGNTTMVYLMMNYSCVSLGRYPFTVENPKTIKTTFDAVTNSSSPKIETVIIGCVSAFTGGDIVSGLYMCGFAESDKINMFIDLGTNAEMAIGDSKKIMTASAAAGPAFEGGLISCGMGSVDGAVYGVDLGTLNSKTPDLGTLNSGTLKPVLKTIGSKPPRGLCGTGILELVFMLFKYGIIDETGLLRDEFSEGFRLTENITFTQKDIRQVQMAKAAVRAGTEILLARAKISAEDVSTVYLAGGFGHGLSVEKACGIGILPKEFYKKTVTVGNSSLGGCVKYASNADADERIEYIRKISVEEPLARTEEFNGLYLSHMNFDRDELLF